MTTFAAHAALKPKEKLRLWQYKPFPLIDSEIEVRVTHNSLCYIDMHLKDNDREVREFPLAVHEVVRIVTTAGKDVTTF